MIALYDSSNKIHRQIIKHFETSGYTQKQQVHTGCSRMQLDHQKSDGKEEEPRDMQHSVVFHSCQQPESCNHFVETASCSEGRRGLRERQAMRDN